MLELLAQATQPVETWAWTNLSSEKLLIWGGIFATAVVVLTKGSDLLIDWWFGVRKRIAKQERELAELQKGQQDLQRDQQMTATATSVLIEANKQNPTTPDVPPEVTAAVDKIANE